jgi:phage-related protein
LQLSLKFAFDQAWNEAGLRKTARWLCQDYYKPLYFSDNPNRIYYTMYKDNPRLLHNALKEGYIDIVFDNIDAYTYSPVYEQIYKLNANSPAGTNLALTNSGDVNCFPILEIQMVNGGSFTICNLSHKGEQFTMTGLADGEKLYIDSETEEIRTDLPLTYRYGNVAEGSVFPKLVYGKNTVNVKGNIELKVKMQYRTLQG